MNHEALIYAAGARTGSPVAKAVLYTLATMADPDTMWYAGEPMWGLNLGKDDLAFLARTVETDIGMLKDVLRRMRNNLPMEAIEHTGAAAEQHGLFEVLFGPGYSAPRQVPAQYLHGFEEQVIACISCGNCQTRPRADCPG